MPATVPETSVCQGRAAEQLALQFLRKQGLELRDSNFRRPYGELDLIMQQQGTLVFVEVRSRRNPDFGGAAASITPAKRRRLRRAAEAYLQRFRSVPPCRFDVVAIDRGQVEWIMDALQF